MGLLCAALLLVLAIWQIVDWYTYGCSFNESVCAIPNMDRFTYHENIKFIIAFLSIFPAFVVFVLSVWKQK